MQTYEKDDLRENEYLKDGMIYCKICNQPKLFDMEQFGDTSNFAFGRFVRVICDCDKKRLQKEEEQAIIKERENYFLQLQKNSLIGERYKTATFENTKTGLEASFDKAFKSCQKYCENYKEILKNGYGIYMYGNCGSGKTHLMACIVNELTKQYQQCLITNFYEISKEIRKTYNVASNSCESDFISKITEIPFLLLDDIGTERLQVKGEDTFIQEKIYDIINSRYINKLPIIFSSNYSLQELTEQKGMWQKTVDRIAEMSNRIFEVKGKSFRLNNNQKDLPF